jgi:signal peptidase I
MTTDALRSRPAKRGRINLVGEAAALIGMLLIFLLLRIFIFQPYTIPSSSEEPNLLQGDYIIVWKGSYGWSKHSFPFSPPLFSGRIFFHATQRGDIVVFKLPRVLDGHVDYIKRLVGLPGDRIQVKNAVVYINGSPLPRTELAPGMGDAPSGYGPVQRYMETASNGRQYIVQQAENDSAADNTGVYVVPPHCYFMMGDNRDNSLDSRFDPAMPAEASGSATCGWDPALDQYLPPESGVGFVPEEDLVGKAVLVLFSWDPRADGRDDGTRVLGLRTNRFARPVS